MIVNLIIYNAGAGGNFLGRVLTLDQTTFPMGGIDIDIPSTADRFRRYCYDNKFDSIKFNSILSNGLSRWVDYELNNCYFPLTSTMETLLEYNLKIIEPIHPHYVEKKINLFGNNDQLNFYYIDPTGCTDWIHKQVQHKIDQNITLDKILSGINLLNLKLTQYSCYPISLANIIKSQSSFIKEYNKICNILNLIAHNQFAIQIYNSWKKTWR